MRSDYPSSWKKRLCEDADKIRNGDIRYYAYHWKSIGNPPNWFLNPFSNQIFPETQHHWTRLSDFLSVVGDLKNIWEASRFEWVVTLARAFAVTGETEYIDCINNWLKDWTEKNSLNEGPNWKCGQEASIRVFNLINTALILDQFNKPSKELCDLIYAHLERINSNILYAIAQDNNHGTSEATALFIGGNWLKAVSNNYPKASKFAVKGRKWLENRMKKLVEVDGGFSQHSVTYHRVLLDTLIFAEFCRNKLELLAFSDILYHKANAAINWLWMLTDEDSGNSPNFGSNDGALFLNFHSCDYRDFRPSLQTALVLFSNKKYFDSGNWDEPLYWYDKLDEKITIDHKKKGNCVLRSGYIIIKSSQTWCLLHFPHYRFRPYHNDVFHFDLWYYGNNILCDAGTFSYNPPGFENNFNLKSVHFHNTVSLDDREQMPTIDRFLMGNWIKAKTISEVFINNSNEATWTGSYVNSNKYWHLRKISLSKHTWTIEDFLGGNFKKAVIGFNVNQPQCYLTGNMLNTDFGVIYGPDDSIGGLTKSVASDYYYEKHKVFRLTFTVHHPGKYITKIILKT